MSFPFFDFSAAPPYQQVLDYSGGSFVVYLGWATPGVATSDAKWKIRKFTYDGNNNVTAIQYACRVGSTKGDVGFVHVWDDRATLTFS